MDSGRPKLLSKEGFYDILKRHGPWSTSSFSRQDVINGDGLGDACDSSEVMGDQRAGCLPRVALAKSLLTV
jgi:hypothetical protein